MRGVIQALCEFDGQEEQGALKIKGVAVIIMIVGDKIVYCLVACFPRGEHFQHNRILRELIWLEERDHHLVFCAGIVGENKDSEIGDADKEKDCKNALLGGGHAVMIPFQLTPRL